MAAVTICSDFGAQENKVCHCFTCVSPSICHEVMGPDAMIFVFWILSFKPAFSLSSFTFKRLFSTSLLSAVYTCYYTSVWFFFANLSHVKLTQISQKNPAAQKETSSSWVEQPHYDFSPFYNQYIYFGFGLGFLIPCSLLWLYSLAKKVLLSVVCIVKRIIFFFFLYTMDTCSVTQLCLTLCDPMDCSLPTPLSMEFSRQEYWRGLPFPLQGIFLILELNPHLLRLLHLQVDSLPLSHKESHFVQNASTNLIHFPASRVTLGDRLLTHPVLWGSPRRVGEAVFDNGVNTHTQINLTKLPSITSGECVPLLDFLWTSRFSLTPG